MNIHEFQAKELFKRFGIPVRVVQTAEFNNEAYLANPNNRCYFCKHELFTELEPIARAEKIYLEELMKTDDVKEGVAAWMEKRAAKWKGK